MMMGFGRVGVILYTFAVFGIFYSTLVDGSKYVDEQVERLYCGKSNCYSLLGVERGATEKEIKKAYRRVALALHPDRNPSPIAQGQMTRVNKAQEILTNKATKAAYDYYLDHPNDLLNLFYGIQAVYPARTNPLFALVLILGFISIAHWVHAYNIYHRQLQEVQSQPAWQEALNERVRKRLGDKEKSIGSKKREAVRNACREEMRIEYIKESNLRPWLEWRETWGWKLFISPIAISKYAMWYAGWVWKYNMNGKEYSLQDKEYLTRVFYDMSQAKWEAYPQSEKAALLESKVWDPVCRKKVEEDMQDREMERSQSATYKRMKRAQKKGPSSANFND